MSSSLSLDHIVIAVADLEGAIGDYRALGFTVIPGGDHPRGSRNALVAFEDGSYLEIIAFAVPQPDFRWWRVLQASADGLVDFALLPDDIEHEVNRARAAGLDIADPQDGARLRPDGEQLSWKTARSPGSDVPFLCGDVTPRHLRVPEGPARRHANGVTGVAELTVAVSDLERSKARYGALLGGGNTGTFRLGRTTITLSTPDADDGDIARHLVARGEGPFAVRFRGNTAQSLDPNLTHGARLEISDAG